MRSTYKSPFLTLLLLLCLFLPSGLRAEGQENEYKGITDPFGDPGNYEFGEEEKEDKEFFHLGRFLMLGIDMGVAAFTGGLGRSCSPGLSLGVKLVYFFDRNFALETSIHRSTHLDAVSVQGGSQFINIDTSLTPITAGIRYHFGVDNAPKVIALANPYIGLGAGMYVRGQHVLSASSGLTLSSGPDAMNTSLGVYGATGFEFSVIRKHIYLGADFRYNLIFFPDKNDTFNGLLQPGDRAGDYFSAQATLTYSF